MAALASLFFFAALAYSSAGFGGGSTYLALLVLFKTDPETIRSTALLCNLAVVSYGTYCFARAGHLKLQKVLPFVVSSIPMSFLGGTSTISEQLFMFLLGASLLVASMRMLWMGKSMEPAQHVSPGTTWLVGVPLGAVLGYLAGVVGIGGGIYLSPVLLFLGWANAKETAAAASFFILVNSLAGLAGQSLNGFSGDLNPIIPLLIAVVLGGQIGSRLGSGYLSKVSVQRITGLLLLVVSGRLLWALI